MNPDKMNWVCSLGQREMPLCATRNGGAYRHSGPCEGIAGVHLFFTADHWAEQGFALRTLAFWGHHVNLCFGGAGWNSSYWLLCLCFTRKISLFGMTKPSSIITSKSTQPNCGHHRAFSPSPTSLSLWNDQSLQTFQPNQSNHFTGSSFSALEWGKWREGGLLI